MIGFFQSLRYDSQNSRNSTLNNPTFQPQGPTRNISREPLLNENHLVTSFPSILSKTSDIPGVQEETCDILRVPAQPNTTTCDNSILQPQDPTQIVSKAPVGEENQHVSSFPSMQNTGLEIFNLLGYISSVSDLKCFTK